MDLQKTALGIEFGSTRIKAVLIDDDHLPVASGAYEWENQLVDGVWTYSMEAVRTGLQTCFLRLREDVRARYGLELTTVGAIGISAMMHGYLPFDREGRQLTEFRTWRNTMTAEAAEMLSELFHFNIPQRWSIAHLCQTVLNREPHVKDLALLTTLAGHIHFRLTGENVVGIGEASGIFPIDSETLSYDAGMMDKFDGFLAEQGVSWRIRDVLPGIRVAGEPAGCLTEEGARFLDPSGTLQPGIPFAPCEGDAETGMTATNSVRPRTGNVSAGTSDFIMIVTEGPLGVHKEVGIVATPDGAPVAMVHCSNCTSDINAWVNLFSEFSALIGTEVSKGELFDNLFRVALEGEPDCGGLLSCNYFSGEAILDFDRGVPLFLRTPDARMTLANFMRTHLLSALATLKIGLDLLIGTEHVRIDRLTGHGGFFKTPGVGQRLMSAAVGAPVSVMETAGEGGPYGMALLAAYMLWKEADEKLPDYLDDKVFKNASRTTLLADEADVEGFNIFVERYKKLLQVERKATEVF